MDSSEARSRLDAVVASNSCPPSLAMANKVSPEVQCGRGPIDCAILNNSNGAGGGASGSDKDLCLNEYWRCFGDVNQFNHSVVGYNIFIQHCKGAGGSDIEPGDQTEKTFTPAFSKGLSDAVALLQLAVKCPVPVRDAGADGKIKEHRTAEYKGTSTEFAVELTKKTADPAGGYGAIIGLDIEKISARFADLEASKVKAMVVRLQCKLGKKCISLDVSEQRYDATCEDFDCDRTFTDPYSKKLSSTNIRLCDSDSADDALAALSALTSQKQATP
ncbi:hypothetical protein NKH47_21680 [Mesorhizobium sp. M1060]|uniref:hypothetical protein n=1 Tax=Mesorhizobium sp. M1060 TaxID=2957052 RepID=UPI00333778DF